MSEVRKSTNYKGAMKVPEFLREPFEAAQARLESFEVEAQKLMKDLSGRFQKVQKQVAKQEWPELRDRLEKMRETGLERAQEWRGKADHFRVEAMERLVELQSKAVKFLGVATREQVEELSREIEMVLKRLEKGGKRRARKPASKAATQTPAQA
ncbi:MAG: hypothetical protein ACXWK5_11280 [Myxococcaceae bacterium]